MTTHKGRDARVEMSGDDGKTWAPIFLDAFHIEEKLAKVGQSLEAMTYALESATIDVDEFSRFYALLTAPSGNSHQRRKSRRAYARWLSLAIERTNRR